MKRMQLDLPDEFPFCTSVDIRIGDINYGQHVGHDAMLALLHEARLRMLRQHGCSEMDVGGCGLIMGDAAIVFQGEVAYPSTLLIEVALANPSRAGFDMVYRVRDAESRSAVAVARTGMICFDYERKRMAKMPEAFRNLFSV